MIYFDNAATSYYRPACVKEAVAEAIDSFGNPSRGAYEASLSADRCMFETRLLLAEMFGADGPDCVSFTMNDTHALNEAIFGLDLKKGDHLIVSLQEHNSVLRPAYQLKKAGVHVHVTGLHQDGTFDIDDYRRILEEIRQDDGKAEKAGSGTGLLPEPENNAENQPRVVTALAHGSNVTGNVIDLGEVSRLCHIYQSLLIIDAAQTAGIIPIDMKKDGIDILCMSGHKALMGPQGTGAILVRRGLSLRTLMAGGSGIKTFLETMPEDMPAHLEAGTQNAHSIAGLRAALLYARGKREEWRSQEMRLKQRLLEGIRSVNGEDGSRRAGKDGGGPCRTGKEAGIGNGDVPDRDQGTGEAIHVYGDINAPESLPTVAFNIRGQEAGDIADRLWRDCQIGVRAGGHCAPLIHRFFGTEKRGIVRASFSHFNTEDQVQILIDELRSIVQEV